VSSSVEPQDTAQTKQRLEQALFEIRRVIAGQDQMLERVLICLLTGGHLLIEGVPGLAKTLTVKTTAGELGPVFCNFLLADEINRAPAKVQSALLEVMQERQVTLGHSSHPVPDPFLVMATQNPIESEGTYPLPEAQVDRFMLKILVDYPSHDEELTVIQRSLVAPPELTQLLSLEELRTVQASVRDVYVDPGLVSYALQLATATRRPHDFGLPDLARFISFGASPRGPISLIHAARGLAVVRGRDYVLVQDLQELVKDALRHRLVLSYEALAERRSADSLLDEVIAAVPVPQLDLSGKAA
jgi:MoxR-like ATPase